MHKGIIIILLLTSFTALSGQDKLQWSGSVDMNVNYFIEDTIIGATDIPQYEEDHLGGEWWVNFNAAYKGYSLNLRGDIFQNSNLLNPTGSYTAAGLGRFRLAKSYKNIDLQLGYIYDQIGSGIIFRSYEERPQLIDNALIGGAVDVGLTDYLTVKGIYGYQKEQFDINRNVIRGVSLEGFWELGKEDNPISIVPGIGYINRQLTDENMVGIVDVLRTYIEEDRTLPRFNVYLGTLYNTLTYKGISWYTEWAIKSRELFFDPQAIRTEITGREVFGRYVKRLGSVFYSSLGLSAGNLGITIEGKRTSNFNFRTNPLYRQNEGLVSFIPPMAQELTYRLLSRYSPATQDLSEWAFQADFKLKIDKRWSVDFNISDIQTLDQTPLYTELYMSVLYKIPRKWQLRTGLQFIDYNQEVYQLKPLVPRVRAVTTFADFLYRFNSKQNIKMEVQYMNTEQDFGSWLFLSSELAVSRRFSIEASGMYNTDPGKESPVDSDGNKLKILYPTFGLTYNRGSMRYNVRYVKQVEGIVCTGGICRLEPAFSGIRLSSNIQL